MSYLVMECHPAYVVVLDEEGRFLKGANLHYQVGQRLTELVKLEQPDTEASRRRTHRRWAVITSMVACLCLVLSTSWALAFTAYGTVRLQINPDIELTVNRFDYVIGAQGLNEDGSSLLEGWSGLFKKIDEAAGQLTRKAGEDGFLKEDGTVHVTVTSPHGQWRDDLEQQLLTTLQEHTAGTVTVIPVSPEDEDDDDLTDRLNPDEDSELDELDDLGDDEDTDDIEDDDEAGDEAVEEPEEEQDEEEDDPDELDDAEDRDPDDETERED